MQEEYFEESLVDKIVFYGFLFKPSEAARMFEMPLSALRVALYPFDLDNSNTSILNFRSLAKVSILSAMRSTGVSMNRIKPAMDMLANKLGNDDFLISPKLRSEIPKMLCDYAQKVDSTIGHLIETRNGEPVFVSKIEERLKAITYNNYHQEPAVIALPGYEHAKVIVDPTRSFGAPIFEQGGARVEDVLDQIRGGDPIEVVAEDFRVPVDHVKDAIRVATRQSEELLPALDTSSCCLETDEPLGSFLPGRGNTRASSSPQTRRCGKRCADGKPCQVLLKQGSRCPHHPF